MTVNVEVNPREEAWLSAKALAAIARLDARIEEGKNATPEERRLADLELEVLLRNLKANREFCG